MKADLHCHTNASDSILSREDLLDLAATRDVDYIAITDHDLMTNSYKKSGDKVKVVTGCEMSAVEPETNKRIHILCYLPKDTAALEPWFKKMNDERANAGAQMLERVQKLYPVVTEERVRRYCPSGIIHKQDMMNVLIDFGYTNEVFIDLFDELFSSRGGSCFVPPKYPNALEIILALRQARGVIVAAHPYVYKSLPFVGVLAKAGLIDGIELNHPSVTEEYKTAIEELCRRYSLIKTGGSDYHGSNSSNHAMPGDFCTDTENIEKLFEASERK